MEWEAANFKDERRATLKDLVKLADYKTHEAEFASYRFVGKINPAAIIRLPIYKEGKPFISPKTGKAVEIPFYALNFDYKTGKFIEGKACPFTDLMNYMNRFLPKPIRPQTIKYVQAINRTVQETGTDENTGKFRRRAKPTQKELSTRCKESLRSACQTPVEVHTVGYMLQQDVQAVIETNKVKVKDTTNPRGFKLVVKPPADPVYGCDVLIKFDSNIKTPKKSAMQKGERTPLTDDEKAFLLWDMDAVLAQLVMSEAEAKSECDRIKGEFNKSLKNGGKASSKDEPDLGDLPDDMEGLGLDDGEGEAEPAPQTRRTQGGTAGKKPGGTKPATVSDEADALFGDDDGIDLETDLDTGGDDDDDTLNFD